MNTLTTESSYDFMKLDAIVSILDKHVINSMVKRGPQKPEKPKPQLRKIRRNAKTIKFNGVVYGSAGELAKFVGLSIPCIRKYATNQQGCPVLYVSPDSKKLIKIDGNRLSINRIQKLTALGYIPAVFEWSE